MALRYPETSEVFQAFSVSCSFPSTLTGWLKKEYRDGFKSVKTIDSDFFSFTIQNAIQMAP